MPIGNYAGTAKINNSKAKNNGFLFRPLKKTLQHTYDWWYSDAVSQKRRDQFESDPNSMASKEAVIIKKWKACHNSRLSH